MSVRSTLRLVSLAAAAATLTACTQPTEDAGEGTVDSTDSAIVGGTTTTAYPAVGALIDENGPFCTATVVAPRVLVTAAHCVVDATPQGTGFVVGGNANTAKTFTRVSKLVAHPQFDMQRIVNDVAVVILASDAPVAPIAINKTALDQSWVGRSLQFVGYGVNNGFRQTGAGIKRQVAMPITQIGATQFAYGDRTHNTCFGDSGGPALLDQGGTVSVVGVTSFGDGTCSQFGVDTRVDAFQSFVAPFLK